MAVISHSWYTMPPGYRGQYTPTPLGVYWHAYHQGERINGGLSTDHEAAQQAAAEYACRHRDRVEEVDDFGSELDIARDLIGWRRRTGKRP